MNHIRHNYPSLIRCLWVFHILVYAYLLFRCYCYNHYKNTKNITFAVFSLWPLSPLSYYFATKHFAADTKFPGVVELKNQLLILENILWLPLCRISKFGLNTLPSKTVAIPYTCGLSHSDHSLLDELIDRSWWNRRIFFIFCNVPQQWHHEPGLCVVLLARVEHNLLWA